MVRPGSAVVRGTPSMTPLSALIAAIVARVIDKRQAPEPGIGVFIEGVEAAARGDDPRCCPYEKMTRERHEWDRGQNWGNAFMAMIEKENTSMTEDIHVRFPFNAGDIVLHPDGRKVQIISGAYEINGRISNHWAWREVMPGGFLSDKVENGYGWIARLPPDPTEDELADIALVHTFLKAMAAKLEAKRGDGFGGWWTCPESELWTLLRGHVEKGDPIDIANIAMMIHGVRTR